MQTEYHPETEVYPLKVSGVHQRLTDGQIIWEHHPDRPYNAASLGKIWITAAAFALAERGDVDLHSPTQISWQEFLDGNYGTGRLRHKFLLHALVSRKTDHQLIPTLTMHTLLKYTIRHSDNLATLKVANALGRPNLQRVINSWGLDNTTIFDPEKDQSNYTTASDVTKFLSLLERGELIRDYYSNSIINWMRNRQARNREGLENEIIYHDGKASDGHLSFCHRAGYIFGQQANHLFVILTKDQPNRGTEVTGRQVKEMEEMTDGIVKISI